MCQSCEEVIARLETLPIVLDAIRLATVEGPARTVDVVMVLADTFGVFASWRLVHQLDANGIIALGANGCLQFTELGRKFHRDIVGVLAVLDGTMEKDVQ